MELKKKLMLTLSLSILATLLFIVAFVFTYRSNFTPVYNLVLFLTVILTITGWSCFSVVKSKYTDAIHHVKAKTGSGNRKNRRKR